MKSKMKVYWIKAQAPHRVLALIKHLKLDVDFVHMDLMKGELHTDEYARLNPNMKTPTLVDGDTILWEASAIMTYLSIKAGSDMWPAANPTEQVEVIKWLSWNDYHWTPAVSPFYFEHVVKTTFGFAKPDLESLKEESKIKDVKRFAKVLNEHLKDKEFVACNRLTIVDFQLASTATHWQESEMPIKEFPHLIKWLERLKAMPAWANPWPA